VLDRWVVRLAPGFALPRRMASSVSVMPSAALRPARRHAGCASSPMRSPAGAVTYQELPASRDVANGTMTPREAIARIPVIPPANRRDLGNITASLAMLDDFPRIWTSDRLIDVDRDFGPLLSELTEVFARVHLANAHNLLTTIVFIHGVTSLAALGSIIPEVSDRTAARGCVTRGSQGAGSMPALAAAQSMAQDIETPRTRRG